MPREDAGKKCKRIDISTKQCWDVQERASGVEVSVIAAGGVVEGLLQVVWVVRFMASASVYYSDPYCSYS